MFSCQVNVLNVHIFAGIISIVMLPIVYYCFDRSGYSAGAVTIYGLNLCDEDVHLNFTGLAGSSLDIYLLTPAEDNDLQSRLE